MSTTVDRPVQEERLLPPAAAPALGRARRPRFLRWLLGFGVPPFLVAVDLTVAAATVLAFGPQVSSFVLLGLVVVLFRVAGLYRPRLTLSALDDAPGIVGRVLVATAVAAVPSVLSQDGRIEGWVVIPGAVCAGTLVLGRVAAYVVIRWVRRRGLIAHRTLVLGAGRVGAQLVTQLRERREHGLVPIGFVDSDPLLPGGERPVPVLGGTGELAQIISANDVRVVIVAFASVPGSRMVDIIRTCDRMECEIFFVPRLFELHQTGTDMDHVWGVPLVRLRRAAFRTLSWRLKRLVDVVVAALGLVLVAPLLASIAVAVRIEGGPGILFRQQRVRIDGEHFSLLKFRTMRPASEHESQTQWSVADDERVGSVGRFLRKTSLDELPQLWNVLVGEMSLVGPRPERPHFVHSFADTTPRYLARHRVPCGLTGWAQVHGLRGDTSIADRARFDNYYIENWSLWLDAKVLLRTLVAVVRRSGA